MRYRIDPDVRRLVLLGVRAAIAGFADVANLYFLAAEAAAAVRRK
jgi:hypothetical protein